MSDSYWFEAPCPSCGGRVDVLVPYLNLLERQAPYKIGYDQHVTAACENCGQGVSVIATFNVNLSVTPIERAPNK